MSIRSLARELYRAQQKVALLQKRHDGAVPGEKAALARELFAAQKELQTLRRMLDGEKEGAATRQRFSGFGSFKK